MPDGTELENGLLMQTGSEGGRIRPTYAVANDLLLRVLGLCLLATFVDKLAQCPGLIGSHGITPLAELLDALRTQHGDQAWWRAPTWFWLSSSDAALAAVTWVGVVASAMLMLGLAPRAAAAVCFTVYLSYRSVDAAPLRWFGWPFDDLLTEVTFLAVFLAPRAWMVMPGRLRSPPRWARVLLLLALWRMMFGTGITKLMAGIHSPETSAAWLQLDALAHFLVTMPQPTARSAWASELPAWILKGGALYTLAYELIAPWCYWWRGRVARTAAVLGLPLMLGIWLTGNFRGLNLLSAAMLMMLWSDEALARLLPQRLRGWTARIAPAPGGRLRTCAATLATALVLLASVEPIARMAGVEAHHLPCNKARAVVRPWHLASDYYMFCVVPPQRFGLVLQGSDDGEVWRDFVLHGLPGPVDRRPIQKAPGHDYLTFPLWLAAFGPPATSSNWLPALLDRLLEGEPTVRALFAEAPFEDRPPRFVRAALFLFSFAPPGERAKGTWWRRQLVGVHTSAAVRPPTARSSSLPR